MKIVSSLLSVVCAALGACGDAPRTPRIELNVYAATSLRDVLAAEESRLESECNVDIVFNFGSSGDLARQIRAAGQADVFFSAGEQEMDDLALLRLVLTDTRTQRISNQLVVIEPSERASSFDAPFAPAQLALARVTRVSLADTLTVPAGRYAKAWLESIAVWSLIEGRVLPGVDVRAALAAVESGGADVGIVYATDAARSKRVRIVHAVPLDEGPRITYPLAALAHRPHEEHARALVTALVSEKSQEAFTRFGFVVVPDSNGR